MHAPGSSQVGGVSDFSSRTKLPVRAAGISVYRVLNVLFVPMTGQVGCGIGTTMSMSISNSHVSGESQPLAGVVRFVILISLDLLSTHPVPE